MTRAPRRLGVALLLVLAAAASGCTHALSQPMPTAPGRLTLKVVPELPSRASDMPLGVHQIPDSPIYVSGHQGAAPGVGMMFGIIGVAVADAAAQKTGETKTKDSRDALKVDVVDATRRAVTTELERRGAGIRFVADGAGEGALEIAPFIVLNFIGEDQVRPWVVLRASLKDAKGGEAWKTRYMASVTDPRPLAGDGGWAADGGAPLRQAVDDSLRAAVAVLFKEAAGELRRDNGRGVKVKGNWVWVKPPLEITSKVLDETESALVVMPDVTDAIVFAGVTVFRKSAVSVTDAPAK